MNRLCSIAMIVFCAGTLSAQNLAWPEISLEAKPAARWWWMGSAVDRDNLTHNWKRMLQREWDHGNYSNLWRARK